MTSSLYKQYLDLLAVDRSRLFGHKLLKRNLIRRKLYGRQALKAQLKRCLTVDLFLRRRSNKLQGNVVKHNLSRTYMMKEALSVATPRILRRQLIRRINNIKGKNWRNADFRKTNFGHVHAPKYRYQLETNVKKTGVINKFLSVLIRKGKRDRAYKILEEVFLKINHIQQRIRYNPKKFRTTKFLAFSTESPTTWLHVVLTKIAPHARLARFVKSGRVHSVPTPMYHSRRMFIASKMLISFAQKRVAKDVTLSDAIVLEMFGILFYPHRSKLWVERQNLSKLVRRQYYNSRYIRFVR